MQRGLRSFHLEPITAQAIRAVLLASATATTLGRLRSSSCMAQPRPAAFLRTSRRADDQETADVAVALLADAGLPLAATAAVGAWRQPEPRGELSSGSEQRDVRDSGGNG